MLIEDLAKWKAILSDKVGKYEKAMRQLLTDNDSIRSNQLVTFVYVVLIFLIPMFTICTRYISVQLLHFNSFTYFHTEISVRYNKNLILTRKTVTVVD